MFTFSNPRALTPEESSPYNNLLSNALKNYQQMQQAQFIRPALEEELKKSKLFNQFYGPNIESEINLRGAQSGHLGATTLGENIKNKYLDKMMQAEIANKVAQANKTNMVQNMIQQILSGQNTNAPNKPGHMTEHGFEGSLTGVPAQDFYANTGPDRKAEEEAIKRIDESIQSAPIEKKEPDSTSMDYPKAALLSQLLGLGKPQIIDVDGKKVAVSPFGNIEVAKGLSKFEEELTKSDVKKVSELEDTVLRSSEKQDTLNSLADIISNPKFQEMRQNPILGQHELSWFSKFGNSEQKLLVGSFRAYTGQIIKDASKDFKGSFRVGEQGLLNSMKPNDSDTIEVMKGKAEALMFMVNKLSQRAAMEANLIRKYRLDPVSAKLKADKLIDSSALKQEIKQRLNPEKNEEKTETKQYNGKKYKKINGKWYEL